MSQHILGVSVFSGSELRGEEGMEQSCSLLAAPAHNPQQSHLSPFLSHPACSRACGYAMTTTLKVRMELMRVLMHCIL